MQVVNIHEAKTQLSRLLAQVQSGHDVVIAKAGNPLVRLVPYAPPVCKLASPGVMAGEIEIGADFDEPLDDCFDCLSQTRQ